MTTNYLPISINLNDRKCLVVGGGHVALRKVDTLLDFECDVTVVAPEINEKIAYYADKKRIQVHQRPYQKGEAAQYGLVVSASNERQVNEDVYRDCQKSGVLANVVDDPAHCDFIFPAMLKRDCLVVTVSTDGKAPFLSGYLKTLMEDIFPIRWNKIARYAAEFRKMVKVRWSDELDKQTDRFTMFLQSDWKTILKEKSDQEIREELDRLVEGTQKIADEDAPDAGEAAPTDQSS